MNDRVRVLCLRHAESENVLAGIAGAVPLAPLTARGRDQATAAGHALAGEPISKVYASTAVRALQTAGVIADTLGCEVVALEELAEVGIGSDEGAVDPATRKRTADVLHAWVVHRDLDQRVADGETGHQVVARMTAAFQEIATAHPGDTIAVVGHVASLTAGLSLLCDLGSRIWGTPLPHAEPFLVEWDGRAWRCSAWPSATI